MRGALSTSAQRELLGHLDQLKFVGVPAHAAPPQVVAAVEDAWFTGRRVRLTYVGSTGERSTRTVRIDGLVMERTLTFLNCTDEALGQQRQFRLDRVERAEPV